MKKYFYVIMACFVPFLYQTAMAEATAKAPVRLTQGSTATTLYELREVADPDLPVPSLLFYNKDLGKRVKTDFPAHPVLRIWYNPNTSDYIASFFPFSFTITYTPPTGNAETASVKLGEFEVRGRGNIGPDYKPVAITRSNIQCTGSDLICQTIKTYTSYPNLGAGIKIWGEPGQFGGIFAMGDKDNNVIFGSLVASVVKSKDSPN